jgi:hypothetical protein
MNRATAPEIRKSLEIVESLKQAGIRFVPIPVLDEEDFKKLISELLTKLDKIEKES